MLDAVEAFSTSQEGGSGRPHGATRIQWYPDPSNSFSVLEACLTTRERPSGPLPNACGALYLSEDGATAYALPLADQPLIQSDQLCVVAIEDLDGDGTILSDGSGDEDLDGLLDLDEGCLFGTDPCLADTDGDGWSDGDEVDQGSDPLDPADPTP